MGVAAKGKFGPDEKLGYHVMLGNGAGTKSEPNEGKKLMAALATVVAGLTEPETIVPTIQDLGVAHLGFGVEDWHYDVVGQALIWTLEQGLGEAFTEEIRD